MTSDFETDVLQRCIVPFGTPRRVWDIVVILVAGFTVIYEPVFQLFLNNFGRFNATSLLFDVILLADGPVNALTAYVTPQQTIIFEPIALLKLYFTGKRWIFGVLTLLTFCVGFVDSWCWAALLLRMCRVVRFVSPGTGSYSEHFDAVYLTHYTLRIAMLFVGLLVYTNFLACTYRHLWFHHRVSKGFYLPLYFDETFDSEVLLLYIATFRTSISMLVNGDTPECQGFVENLFGVVVSLSMLLIASLMVGECSMLMTYLRRDEMEFQCELGRMRSFLRRRKIPAALQDEVVEFVRHRYEHEVAYDASLMEQLPSTLVYKLRSSMLGDIASSVPIFRGADTEYIRCVMVKLNYQFYFASDTIFHHGDLDQSMFLLMSGRVSLTTRDGEVVSVLEYNGAHFGEEGVLADQHRRQHTALALIYSDVCNIHRDDLDEIHREFPERRSILADIKTRRQSHITKGGVFNDDDLVEHAMLTHAVTKWEGAHHTVHGIPVKFFASDLKNLHLKGKRRSTMVDQSVLLKRTLRETARAATVNAGIRRTSMTLLGVIRASAGILPITEEPVPLRAIVP